MSLHIKSLSMIPSQFWLKKYYYLRATFLSIWVAAAFTVGQKSSDLAAALIIVFPAWDALANYFDATKSGGLAKSKLQTINLIVSFITVLAVTFSFIKSTNEVMAVFCGWAILSGLLQTGAAVQRWNTNNAQWIIILGGAQSALAGPFFIFQPQLPLSSLIIYIAGYAAYGAFYFFISAFLISLILKGNKKLLCTTKKMPCIKAQHQK